MCNFVNLYFYFEKYFSYAAVIFKLIGHLWLIHEKLSTDLNSKNIKIPIRFKLNADNLFINREFLGSFIECNDIF